jgi:hypothetical protein
MDSLKQDLVILKEEYGFWSKNLIHLICEG